MSMALGLWKCMVCMVLLRGRQEQERHGVLRAAEILNPLEFDGESGDGGCGVELEAGGTACVVAP